MSKLIIFVMMLGFVGNVLAQIRHAETSTWGVFYKNIMRGKYSYTVSDYGLMPGIKRITDYHGSPQVTSVPQDYTIITEFSKTGKLMSTRMNGYHFNQKDTLIYDVDDRLLKIIQFMGGDSVVYTYDQSGKLDRKEHYFPFKNEFLYSTRFIYEQLGDTLTVYEIQDKYVRSRSSEPESTTWQFVLNENDQLVFEKKSAGYNGWPQFNTVKYSYDSSGDLVMKKSYNDTALRAVVKYENDAEIESLHYVPQHNGEIVKYHFKYAYKKDSLREVIQMNDEKEKWRRHVNPSHFGIPDRAYYSRHAYKKRTQDSIEELPPIGEQILQRFSTVSFTYY